MRPIFTCFALITALSSPLVAEQVGEVGVDWVGNDIIIEAIQDPKVSGVTCHIAYFDRGLIDRLSKATGSKTRQMRLWRAARPVQLKSATLIAARAVRMCSVKPGLSF